MRFRTLALDTLWFATGISLGVMAATLYIDQTRVEFSPPGPAIAEIITG